MSTPTEKLRDLQEGQLLLVETERKELLFGVIKAINIKYLIIELDNVRDIRNNFVYETPQILAYTEMLSIKVVLNENELEISESFSNDTEKSLMKKKSDERQEKDDEFNIHLSALDFQLLQKQIDNMMFLTAVDHKYYKAINDIKSQSVIGLLIDPIDKGRNSKTSLLAISTPQNIYVFDMLAFGLIFKDMRSILEADRPRKAVHFSHKIADHLKYRHKVLIKGIFDTFLAYCVVTNKKTNITLEETVQKIFNLPNVYFDADLESEIPVSSYKRPMPQNLRIVIAKKVAFQLKLYDYLLHEYMLKNFYTQCGIFSEIFLNTNDNYEVAQQLLPRNRAGYEHIQPNGNWNEKLNIELNSFATEDQDLNNINGK